jgi:hypothetical protein
METVMKADKGRMGIRVALLAACLLAAACGEATWAQTLTGRLGAKPHLVVMKQDEIRGKVFFLAEENEKEQPADELKVEVWTPDSTNLIQSTMTDTNGAYKLPSLQVGRYRMVIGKLDLELRVEDPLKITPGTRTIPKTIIVLIPRSLGPELHDQVTRGQKNQRTAR